MASPRSTISSLNLKQTRKKKTDSGSEKKSIFNLIFHHHSRRLARTLPRCVYYFPKGLSSFFPHTHTHTTLFCVHFTRVRVFVRYPHRSVCPDVSKSSSRHCFVETPSIQGGGASVYTLAFFFIRNAHTHTHAHT
uniref:(northern house mosquito) hypothetical protein n=1 Tax=Culex pipiens TaxID=7175 RepID=A0A8D8CST3_CULPI